MARWEFINTAAPILSTNKKYSDDVSDAGAIVECVGARFDSRPKVVNRNKRAIGTIKPSRENEGVPSIPLGTYACQRLGFIATRYANTSIFQSSFVCVVNLFDFCWIVVIL